MIMAGDEDEIGRGGFPRCSRCGAVVRVRGVDIEGLLCSTCIAGALPFAGIVTEGDFKVALREYREGIMSGVGDFGGLRLDPYDEDMRAALGGMDRTLKSALTWGTVKLGAASRVLLKMAAAPSQFFFIILGVQRARGWSCWRRRLRGGECGGM